MTGDDRLRLAIHEAEELTIPRRGWRTVHRDQHTVRRCSLQLLDERDDVARQIGDVVHERQGATRLARRRASRRGRLWHWQYLPDWHWPQSHGAYRLTGRR